MKISSLLLEMAMAEAKSLEGRRFYVEEVDTISGFHIHYHIEGKESAVWRPCDSGPYLSGTILDEVTHPDKKFAVRFREVSFWRRLSLIGELRPRIQGLATVQQHLGNQNSELYKEMLNDQVVLQFLEVVPA